MDSFETGNILKEIVNIDSQIYFIEKKISQLHEQIFTLQQKKDSLILKIKNKKKINIL